MSGVAIRPAALIRGASMNAHGVAVDRLAREARDVDQRAEADLVRAARQEVEAELRDHAVLADQRHDVGERADRRDLDERGQPLLPRPSVAHSACTSFSATPTPGQVLVRVARSRGASD